MHRHVRAERRDEGLIASGDAPSETDEQLVVCAQVHPAAFAALYERYVDVVYWYCARRARDAWGAEDATAQVFSQAFAALQRFDSDKGTFRSWLFRIAHNVTVDRARRWRPHWPLDSALTLADPRPTPEEALLAGESERTLRRALAALTADQRAVVELRLAGLRGAEVAQTLGRSQSWVNTTHFRAIARLRNVLGVEPRPEESADGER